MDRAVAVARQVLEALAYAHRRGVVHRDIKPENILLDAAGTAKVSDFGIARLLGPEKDAGITAVGRLAGTPRYVAPEALAGAAPDPRMDVYAVGVVLREMVTGREPAACHLPSTGSSPARLRPIPISGTRAPTRWRTTSSGSLRARPRTTCGRTSATGCVRWPCC